MMDGRRVKAMLAAVAGLLLLAFALPNRHADIRILTADQGDTAPHRMQAAVDLGGFAISVLVTWTSRIVH